MLVLPRPTSEGTRALALRCGSQNRERNIEGWAADTALKRLGEPRELADTIVWLASERASYITDRPFLVRCGLYKGL